MLPLPLPRALSFLSIVMVLPLIAAGEISAWGQELSRPPAADAPVVLEPPPTLIVDSCDQDFWMVSSRECPQKGKGSCLGCRFGYYRCKGGQMPCRSHRRAFHDWLQPGVPVCIFVHGSYTDWDVVCRDSTAIYRWLRQAAPHLPTQFVVFTWASGSLRPVPNPDVGTLGIRSSFNGRYLAQLVDELPPGTPVSLLGFSHGSRTAAAALHALGGGDLKGYRHGGLHRGGRRLRAAFITAAIDRHWLNPGQRYGRALCAAESLLYLRSREDWVLGLYPFRRPFSRQSLGRAGLSARDRAALGVLNAKVAEMDVTPLVGSGHVLTNYVRRPEIAAALAPYVGFAETAEVEPVLSVDSDLLGPGHRPD